MYRIFCENYYNFANSFDADSYRLRIAKPEELREQTKLVNSFLKLAYWY